MSLMWIFYSNVGDDAKGFYSKSAMILNILGLAYGISSIYLYLGVIWDDLVVGTNFRWYFFQVPVFGSQSVYFRLGGYVSVKNMMKGYTLEQRYF